VYYLMLDVETTSEDMPQIVSIEAELYRCSMNSQMQFIEQISSVTKPSRGYAVLRHMQDVRHHGVTAEMMSDRGDDAVEALARMLAMVRQRTGKLSLDAIDGPTIIVVAHGTQGMLANLMAAAKVDQSMHQYWDELEALCQRTDDTLPMAIRNFPGLTRYTLEYCVAVLGHPLPETRARAVALLFSSLRNFTLHDEW
jgi:hypothetical protein